MNHGGRLIHYSRSPLPSRLYDENNDRLDSGRAFKPRGFWVSVEGPDDWLSWCVGEQYGLSGFAHATEIKLANDANILTINGETDLDRFTEQYGIGHGSLGGRVIDWPMVAKRHDGIIIAPYVHERRYTRHTIWYYPWDCASGCIWKMRAIAEMIRVDPPVLTVSGDDT